MAAPNEARLQVRVVLTVNTTIAHTVLEELLREDGIHVPRGGGVEKAIKCFAPDHNDTTPSLSVNVVKGLYNCHGCGLTGNAYSYLTEIRGYSPAEAMRTLEKAGATANHSSALQAQDKANKERAARLPRHTKDIYNKAKITKDVLGERTAIHTYATEDGEIVFLVGRYEAWRDGKEKKDKTFRPFTPSSDRGGYWVVAPRSEQCPFKDRVNRYPIYRLPEIAKAIKSWARAPEAQKQQIWLVEGEKCADLIARLKPQTRSGKSFTPLVCALYGGSKHPLESHDLSPLYGQRVLLLADSDTGGRKYMKDLGRHLTENRTECRYFLPDGKDGMDVGDVAGDGWEAVIAFIRDGGGVKSHDDVFPPTEAKTDETTLPQAPMGDTPYFTVLGFEAGMVVVQSKVTHRIHKVPAGTVGSEGQLIYLAPLSFWRGLAGGKDPSAKHRLVWADQIIRAAENKGEMSTQSTHMWERGAHKRRDGSIVYNVGSHVLSADIHGNLSVQQPLTTHLDSGEIFLPGPAIHLTDHDKAYLWAADFYEALLRYRWETLEHGQAFAGWCVTSLIGGALPFRPMLWLTALPGSGKTFLMSHVLQPLFGNLLTDWANATEAGMAVQTQDTALPAVLDEFEPEPGKERRMQDILGLIRVATSGGAARVRGNAKGGYVMSRPRFSLLMASVDRPTLSEANAQRITSIRLSAAGVEDWPGVRDALLKAVEPERAAAIRTHIIRNTAHIANHATEIEDEMIAEGAPTRDAQIRSALSAGVCFLAAEDGFRLGRRAATLSDTFRPFMSLMQGIVRSKHQDDMTLADILDRAYFEDDRTFVLRPSTAQREYQHIALRMGFKFADEETLLCAIDWRAMTDMLRDTVYANIDLSEYLLRMPGARRAQTEAGLPRRVTFAGVTKQCIALDRSDLRRLGLFP